MVRRFYGAPTPPADTSQAHWTEDGPVTGEVVIRNGEQVHYPATIFDRPFRQSVWRAPVVAKILTPRS